jgi:hypothetical protein
MAEVVSPDTAPPSSSWITRNIRPIMVANMLILLNVFVVIAVIEPKKASLIAEALTQVPDYVWAVIGGATGLYSIGRSVEKVKGVA